MTHYLNTVPELNPETLFDFLYRAMTYPSTFSSNKRKPNSVRAKPRKRFYKFRYVVSVT